MNLEKCKLEWCEKIFSKLNNLVELSVEKCCINTINKDTFYGLHNLTCLMFNDNIIDNPIDSDIFENISNLRDLYFEGNKTKIPVKIFSPLKKLEELRMYGPSRWSGSNGYSGKV